MHGTLIVQSFLLLACERLVARTFAPHELPSLIEAILSSKEGGGTIGRLRGDDAQTFVDVIDEARSTFVHRHESRLIEVDVRRSLN